MRVRCQDCKHEELNKLNPGVGMSGCKVLDEHWYPSQLHACVDFAAKPVAKKEAAVDE